MSNTCVELTVKDFEVQPSISAPLPPSNSSSKFKFGSLRNISLTRNISLRTDKDFNHFTMLTIHQVFVLICSILLMILALQIPTILYFTSTSLPTSSSSFINEIDFKTCSVNADRFKASASQSSILDYCPEIPPGINQDQLFYNICLTTSLSLVQSMDTINSALKNEQCNNSAVPFFCDAMYFLCGGDNAAVDDDLMEECVEVRDNDCPVEWRVLENLFDAQIPSYESYTANKSITFAKAPPLKCPNQFDTFCGSVCLPVCEEYSQVPQDATVASDVLNVMFVIIGLIGGLVTLAACFCNREKMLKFPQIYIVYNTINLLIIFILFILPLIFGRSNLLCSDSNLIETLKNPAEYCQAQGFILQTGIVYFFGFLLFHLGHLLFAIAFPLKAKSFMTDHTRIAHVVEMTIIIILGSLPGIVILSVSKYRIKSFLPYLCVPGSRDMFFYTLTLPIVIGATVGLTMLLTAFWILRRNHQLKAIRSKEDLEAHETNTIMMMIKVLCTGFSSPEKKLFILFWYYILVLIVLLTFLTVQSQTTGSTFELMENYFTCSIGGYRSECDVYRKKIETTTWPSYYLGLASTLLLCSITLSNLTYVLQITEIKNVISKLCKSKTHAYR